jgi:WD40 repeat protein
MAKKYPFKFLNSYGKEDRDIFFGRDEEIEALYEMVFQVPIMVVYGASGTGKTSLIQCGLASRFKSVDWLALTIRRGSNINESLEKALKENGGNEFIDEADTENERAKELTGLQQLIKSVYLKNFKPIYLIFDQFEELYIMGNSDEQNRFIEAVKEILHAEHPVKMIFSIREEYLGHLFEFEKEVPQLLHKKLRVEPMDLEKVKTVIREIGRSPQSLVTIEAGKEDLIAESIFKKVRGEENTLTIQLPYFQVFLDKLYRDNADDKTYKKEWKFTLAEVNKMPEIDKILYEFLDKVVKDATTTLGQKEETIWKILSPFVTLEGTKKPLSVEELDMLVHNENDLNIRALKIFEDSRILRYIEKDKLYEIAHDALAKQVKTKQSVEVINILKAEQLIKNQFGFKDKFHRKIPAEELDFIKPYESNLKLEPNERAFLEESKRDRDRKIKFKRFSQIFIFGLIAIGLFFFGYLYKQSSEKNKFRDDIKPIENLIASALSNMDRSSFNEDKDPTLALQLEKKAMLSLDSAYKLMDSLCNKTYAFNGEYIKTEYDKLKSNYDKKDLMIKTQSKILAEKDYALYRVVNPVNSRITDSLLRKVLRNEIFANDSLRESEFRVWNGSSGRIDSIKNFGNLSALVFPKDNIIAMALYNEKNDISIAGYWDSASLFRKVQNKNERISSIAPIMYSVIKYKMLSAVKNKTIVEWDLNGTIRKSSTIPVVYKSNVNENIHIDENVVSIAISPDRKVIFTASANGMGKIWPADVSKIKLDTSVIFNLQQDTIISSAFSKDGSMIVTGSKDNTVKIWNAIHGTLIKVLNGHLGPVTSVTFSAMGNFVYTGSLDGTYRQWQVPKVDRQSQMPPTKWNKTKDFDSLFIMKIIEPDPAKPKNK